MATVQLTGAVFVGGFDLSCYLKSVTMNGEADMHDSTTLCTTGFRSFQPGLVERNIAAEGFFAYDAVDDTLSVDKLFSDAMSASVSNLITVGQEGATLGYPAVMMNSRQASHDVAKIEVGELIMTSFEAKATIDTGFNTYAQGVFLMSQVVTGAVNGTGYDDGAGATAGWFCQVHNTDADGTATVKVQHSTDNAVWVDLIDFGAVAQNGAEQSVDTSTSVNRYIRAIVTAIGGTTNKVTVAIKTGYTG